MLIFPIDLAMNTIRNSTDHIAIKSAKPSSNFRQRFSWHANVESTNRDIRLKIPARSAPTSGFSSPSASPPRLNARDLFASRVATESTKSSGDSNRVLSNDVNVEGAKYKFRGVTSPRSAPTSGLPSPATVSPQRSYTGDFLPTLVARRENQVQSTLEIPDFGRLASHSSQVPPVKTVFSPERSPFHSPTLQSSYLNPKNIFSFLSNHKLFQGSSNEWPESSHASAHPLPLPPKAAPLQFSIPSPPAVIHNTLEKLNVPFNKNQWVKGKLIGSGTYGRVYIGTNR
jgi:mitogen-activated protein kinase kinase kinase